MESATVLHPDGCNCMKSPCHCKQQRWRRHRRHRKASRERIFQTEWLTKYAWFKYEDGEMYCSVCKAFKKKNTLTSGSTNFCTSTLVRHIESRDHRESVIASVVTIPDFVMRYISRYLGHDAIRIAILVYRVNQCLYLQFVYHGNWMSMTMLINNLWRSEWFQLNKHN